MACEDPVTNPGSVRWIPVLCPVCRGTGSVPAGFYLSGLSPSTSPEVCRRCMGVGTVWGQECTGVFVPTPFVPQAMPAETAQPAAEPIAAVILDPSAAEVRPCGSVTLDADGREIFPEGDGTAEPHVVFDLPTIEGGKAGKE